MRPFFALDGSNVKAGVDAAKKLIAECQPEFENSALFLFFQGRVERLEVCFIQLFREIILLYFKY